MIASHGEASVNPYLCVCEKVVQNGEADFILPEKTELKIPNIILYDDLLT